MKPSTVFVAALLLSCCCASGDAQTIPPRGGTAPKADSSAMVPEPSASARQLFSRYKDRLVQVRVLLRSANEQSSLGSGFVVRDDGARGAVVLTNYHVISSLAIDPKQYRIELRGTNGRTVKAQVVALDVIHDLAVLRTEAGSDAMPWSVFALREEPLEQGSRVFSLGNPLELGFLISEGLYNGQVESRIYEEMLFSGALNAGMSGGPAIDAEGRVVGVNVAARRDGEQLSFLVPVRYARELLARASTAAPPADWRDVIGRQLLAHQDFLTSKLTGSAGSAASASAGLSSQVLSGRTVPTLDATLTKCWAGGRDGERLRFRRDTLSCDLHTSLFVRDNLYTGTVDLKHEVLHKDELSTPQFLALGEEPNYSQFLSGGGKEFTPRECRGDYVRAAARVYRVSICVRGYRKFADLYNYAVEAIQVDDARMRQTSRLTLSGFSFENAQHLARLFLGRLE